jgi:hypothetical protein
MPEYLAPGVYVEETSFRAKTIEGVSTSTAGFVGPARFGPVSGLPELITSLAEFERIYGGLDPLEFSTGGSMANYLAHAVRAFFDNDGKRLYISRVFSGTPDTARASRTVPEPGSPPPSQSVTLRARYPGRGGNLSVVFFARLGQNILGTDGAKRILRGSVESEVAYVEFGGSFPPSPEWFSVERRAELNTWALDNGAGSNFNISAPPSDKIPASVRILTVNVEVTFPGRSRRVETWENLSLNPKNRRSLSQVFAAELKNRMQALTVPLVMECNPKELKGTQIAQVLLTTAVLDKVKDTASKESERLVSYELTNGSDGNRPGAGDYEGSDSDLKKKTGLKAFEDVPNISIVAAPGYSHQGQNGFATNALQIMGHLISHCERMKYRIAVLDSADEQGQSQVLQYRAQVDSKHAALYYPWVRIVDPISDVEIHLPPSGFVAGIYARNDIERGVHKAPANEVVRGAIGFEVMLNKAQQDVLNPEGVNCFRYFEGRGYRLWGARTISSDPEWKYVNLRRYFAYLERSIERGTQWVVFENNSEPLWANVRRTVEDFLFNEWKNTRLMGEKPEEAYFVRCDRSTMTQNDLDNGRLVCLIGVSPVRPAEFVIFRIGQWTADRRA